jgi:hypothetical protein
MSGAFIPGAGFAVKERAWGGRFPPVNKKEQSG